MSRTLGGCSFFEPCDGLGTHIKGRGVISELSLSATKSISCSRFRRGQSRNKNPVETCRARACLVIATELRLGGSTHPIFKCQNKAALS